MMRAFADALVKLLREERENYTEDISKGRCNSFDEYKRLCGLIQGLELSERHIEDLANNMENDNA
jgi:hypothetical protein